MPNPVDDVQEPVVDDVEKPQLEEITPPEDLQKPAPKAPAPHPLTPGGKRFEQIYAQAKNAERELAKERELRLAAEAQLKGKSAPEEDTKEYSWAELETFIAQGRITRADAEQHREDVRVRNLTQRITSDIDARTKNDTRAQALGSNIEAYVKAAPAVLQEGSADRQRLDEEFDWLASVQGKDSAKLSDLERKTLQLQALRNVYGPIDSLVARQGSVKVESHQETPGGTPPRKSSNPDQALIDGLTKRQVDYYKDAMKRGRYKGGWKDVVEELKYEPPTRGR